MERVITESGDTGSPKPNATTRLAADRTRLAYERTLMAWVRTAISLISFGFTIYKFFQIELAGKPDRAISATAFSLLMIIIGLISLVMATLEHRRDLNGLRVEYPYLPGSVSLARILAALVSVLGIMALIAVIFRQ